MITGWLGEELVRVAGAALLAIVIFIAGLATGIQHERNKQLADTVAANSKRIKVDANVDGRSDYQLCIDAGGVPDKCQQLRGVVATPKGQ